MLLLKIGPELINLDAVTRVAFREEADGLDVHFAGGTSLWLGGPAAAAFQEELVALHDARLLVIRNRPEAGGGNGHGRVPHGRELLRTLADGHGGGAVQAGHGHAQGAGTAVTLGGVPGHGCGWSAGGGRARSRDGGTAGGGTHR